MFREAVNLFDASIDHKLSPCLSDLSAASVFHSVGQVLHIFTLQNKHNEVRARCEEPKSNDSSLIILYITIYWPTQLFYYLLDNKKIQRKERSYKDGQQRDTISIHGRPTYKKKIIKNKSKIKSVGSCSQIVRHTPPKAGNT